MSQNISKEEVVCPTCGKRFMSYLSHKRKYCSRYCYGENLKTEVGKKSKWWKGGKHISGDGYFKIKKHGHPRSDGRGYVRESILVAEKILKKPLPPKAVVHHVNHIRTDNRPENLVVCQDNGYHLILHARERAYKDCGHSDWKKCCYCHQYDYPKNLYINPKIGSYACHRSCAKLYRPQRNNNLKLHEEANV